MPEWWTYSPSDFLLFSPRAYYRLFELHNAAVWPGHVLVSLLGVVILLLLWHPVPWQGRAISGITAVLWAWVAWAFLWKRYATINWAATYVAVAFAVEALMLLWVGVARGKVSFRRRRDADGVAGIVLFVVALAGYPLLARLLGRPWTQAEVFGMAPDPTVFGTVGLLLLVEGRRRWDLLVIPVLWCLLSGGTLWTMGSTGAWILALPVIAVLVAFFPRRGST